MFIDIASNNACFKLQHCEVHDDDDGGGDHHVYGVISIHLSMDHYGLECWMS